MPTVAHIARRAAGWPRVIALWLLLAAAPAVVQAQDQRITINTVVEGRLAAGASQRYTFDGVAGEMVSVLARSPDGLDVALALSTGTMPLLSNDDYAYPTTTDALLEGVTLPRTGTYTVAVQSVAGTTGSFTLALWRGYADVLPALSFDQPDDWAVTSGDADVRGANGTLVLALAGPGDATVANMRGARIADAYTEASVQVVGARGPWEVGFVVRMAASEQSIQATLNERGLWRLTRRDGATVTVLRDWVSHPAITPGQTAFRLGVLANAAGFEVFYNSSPLGAAVDATLPAGVLGFALGTSSANGLELVLSDFHATTPLTIGGQGVLPQQVLVGDAATMVQELTRRRVVRPGGALALTVPTSSGQATNVGVSRLPLGRGVTYTDLVIAGTVSLVVDGGGPAGCGLVLRAASDSSYLLAYADSDGGLGLSARTGERFAPGLYEVDATVGPGELHILVVAVGDTAHLYVNGLWRGTLPTEATNGGVGNALVNFAPASTRCTFSDTWVYRLDGAPS